MTIKQVIELFLGGAEEGYTGSKSNPGNLKIKGDKLFHYSTVIRMRKRSASIPVGTHYPASALAPAAETFTAASTGTTEARNPMYGAAAPDPRRGRRPATLLRSTKQSFRWQR